MRRMICPFALPAPLLKLLLCVGLWEREVKDKGLLLIWPLSKTGVDSYHMSASINTLWVEDVHCLAFFGDMGIFSSKELVQVVSTCLCSQITEISVQLIPLQLPSAMFLKVWSTFFCSSIPLSQGWTVCLIVHQERKYYCSLLGQLVGTSKLPQTLSILPLL